MSDKMLATVNWRTFFRQLIFRVGQQAKYPLSDGRNRKLVARSPTYQTKLLPTTGNLELENWLPSIGLTVQKKINNCVLESELHAIEQVPSKIQDQLVELSPIRFFFNNKLGNDDKLLLAFDAFVLSESLGREIKVGKIIHGDNSDTLRVNVSVLSAHVQKRIEKSLRFYLAQRLLNLY